MIDRPRVLAVRAAPVVVAEGGEVRVEVLAAAPDGTPDVVVDVCRTDDPLVYLTPDCFGAPGFGTPAFEGASGVVTAPTWDDPRLAPCRDVSARPLGDDGLPEAPASCENRLWIRARVPGTDEATVTSVTVLLSPRSPPDLVPLAELGATLTVDPPDARAGDDVRLSLRLPLPDDVVAAPADTATPGDTDIDPSVATLRWYVGGGLLHQGGVGGVRIEGDTLVGSNRWRLPDDADDTVPAWAVVGLIRPGSTSRDVTWATATVGVSP